MGSNIIQLKLFSESQMDIIINGDISDMRTQAKSVISLAIEPEKSFSVLDYKDFNNSDKYDLVFLTQSPGFTPKTADFLIPIIKQYIGI